MGANTLRTAKNTSGMYRMVIEMLQ